MQPMAYELTPLAPASSSRRSWKRTLISRRWAFWPASMLCNGLADLKRWPSSLRGWPVMLPRLSLALTTRWMAGIWLADRRNRLRCWASPDVVGDAIMILGLERGRPASQDRNRFSGRRHSRLHV